MLEPDESASLVIFFEKVQIHRACTVFNTEVDIVIPERIISKYLSLFLHILFRIKHVNSIASYKDSISANFIVPAR